MLERKLAAAVGADLRDVSCGLLLAPQACGAAPGRIPGPRTPGHAVAPGSDPLLLGVACVLLWGLRVEMFQLNAGNCLCLAFLEVLFRNSSLWWVGHAADSRCLQL